MTIKISDIEEQVAEYLGAEESEVPILDSHRKAIVAALKTAKVVANEFGPTVLHLYPEGQDFLEAMKAFD